MSDGFILLYVNDNVEQYHLKKIGTAAKNVAVFS